MSDSGKNFEESLPLCRADILVIDVLLKAGYPLVQKAIKRDTRLSEGQISKSLKKLKMLNIVEDYKRKSVFDYEICLHRKEEAEKIVTGFNFGKSKEVLLDGHAFVYEAELNEIPPKLQAALKAEKDTLIFIPRNWTLGAKKVCSEGVVKLHKTKNGAKVFFYLQTIGFDPYIIDFLNIRKLIFLKQSLEDNYFGLKIGSPNCIAKATHKEIALLSDPLAVVAIKHGIKHRKIEDSWSIGGEWEEKGINAEEDIRKVIWLRELCIANRITDIEVAGAVKSYLESKQP